MGTCIRGQFPFAVHNVQLEVCIDSNDRHVQVRAALELQAVQLPVPALRLAGTDITPLEVTLDGATRTWISA
jgi:hypothetical protein